MTQAITLSTLARAMPSGLAVLDTAGLWQPARHHEALNEKLLDVAAGRIRRLVVSMPPQHGKSTLTSHYFPAWFLGRFPRENVNLVSYERDQARRWGRKARDTLAQHGPGLFDVGVRAEVESAQDWETTKGGGMFATGIGGPLTGRPGNILIDDPIKNAEEALSKKILENHWDWWRTTARTRMHKHHWAIVMMTRWGERDLIGRILAEDEDDWTILRIPAIAEPGDTLGRPVGAALWPERHPLSELEKIRTTQGSYWWNAMYQGTPVPDEGRIYRRETFRYFTETDDAKAYVLQTPAGDRRVPKRDCSFVSFCDPALSEGEESDYFALTVWAVTPAAEILLVDLVHVKAESTKHLSLVRGVLARWGGMLKVEKASYGLALLQQLRAAGISVGAVAADRDKVARARAGQGAYESGFVYHPAKAPWLAKVEAELLAFPVGEHDDIADTVAYACTWRQYEAIVHASESVDLGRYY